MCFFFFFLAAVFLHQPTRPSDRPTDLPTYRSVSAKVVVQKEGQKATAATVTKAHATLVDYDILYQDGTMEKAVPAHLLRDRRVRRGGGGGGPEAETDLLPPPPDPCES